MLGSGLSFSKSLGLIGARTYDGALLRVHSKLFSRVIPSRVVQLVCHSDFY